MNDICKVQLRTTQPLMIDSYTKSRTTGSFILIDSATYETVAAGMIV
jgi:sulfate adenylyltransferase subunit 1